MPYTTLGDLQILPRDVLVNIFQFFTLSEAVALLTVNKKLLQIIACKQIWLKGLGPDRVVSAQGKFIEHKLCRADPPLLPFMEIFFARLH